MLLEDFDAKYRINPAYEGKPYLERNWIPRQEEDDINTMHRYRDAIVYSEGREVEEWVKRDTAIVPARHGIYRILYTTDYMIRRAKEVSELRLDTEEELRDWHEKRRVGKVKVMLDREHLDLGSSVVGIGVTSVL